MLLFLVFKTGQRITPLTVVTFVKKSKDRGSASCLACLQINLMAWLKGLGPQLVFKTVPVKELHHWQRWHLSKDRKTEEVPVAWLVSKSTWWPDWSMPLSLEQLKFQQGNADTKDSKRYLHHMMWAQEFSKWSEAYWVMECGSLSIILDIYVTVDFISTPNQDELYIVMCGLELSHNSVCKLMLPATLGSRLCMQIYYWHSPCQYFLIFIDVPLTC